MTEEKTETTCHVTERIDTSEMNNREFMDNIIESAITMDSPVTMIHSNSQMFVVVLPPSHLHEEHANDIREDLLAMQNDENYKKIISEK